MLCRSPPPRAPQQTNNNFMRDSSVALTEAAGAATAAATCRSPVVPVDGRSRPLSCCWRTEDVLALASGRRDPAVGVSSNLESIEAVSKLALMVGVQLRSTPFSHTARRRAQRCSGRR